MRIARMITIAPLLAGCLLVGEAVADSKDQMKDIKMQRMAKGFMQPFLKDPDSAKYRNTRGFCGEVNSKNSFGGYGGFQRFIAAGEGMVILERDSGLAASDFNTLWATACDGAK